MDDKIKDTYCLMFTRNILNNAHELIRYFHRNKEIIKNSYNNYANDYAYVINLEMFKFFKKYIVK